MTVIRSATLSRTKKGSATYKQLAGVLQKYSGGRKWMTPDKTTRWERNTEAVPPDMRCFCWRSVFKQKLMIAGFRFPGCQQVFHSGSLTKKLCRFQPVGSRQNKRYAMLGVSCQIGLVVPGFRKALFFGWITRGPDYSLQFFNRSVHLSW